LPEAWVLTGLRLENIALIERLELVFSTGFTVLTGETGAGKSILLDALDALSVDDGGLWGGLERAACVALVVRSPSFR